MAPPSINRRGNKAKGIPDTWECRYFVHDSKPPHGFEHDRLMKEKGFFDKWDGPLDENDIYFISDDTDVNVKLRKSKKRKPLIKVKVFLYNSGEFELWRTEIDDELPAPAEVWREVLASLKVVKVDPEQLSSCSEPDQVIDKLDKAEQTPPCRRTRKCRWRYTGPQGEVEVARVTIDSSVFYSVSFESNAPDPSGIRAIRDKLRTDELGTPKNYVELLSEMFLK